MPWLALISQLEANLKKWAITIRTAQMNTSPGLFAKKWRYTKEFFTPGENIGERLSKPTVDITTIPGQRESDRFSYTAAAYCSNPSVSMPSCF